MLYWVFPHESVGVSAVWYGCMGFGMYGPISLLGLQVRFVRRELESWTPLTT